MFNRMFAGLVVLFCAFVVTSVQPAGAISKYYSSQTVRSLFPGTFEARVEGGRQLFIKASANGKLKASLSIGLSDNGRWSVQRDKLCMSLDKWTDGKRYCSRVWKTKGWHVVSSLGRSKILFKRSRK